MEAQTIHRPRMRADGPLISHLYFANDSYSLQKGVVEEANKIKHVLLMYEEASWQVISFQKSSILFGKYIGAEKESEIMEILDVVKCQGEGKYLGLPYLVA